MVNYKFTVSTNNQNLNGSFAGPKVLFGEFNRYAVAPVHTRFDAVEWFVWDAHLLDEAGRPEVIRQAKSFDDAVSGL